MAERSDSPSAVARTGRIRERLAGTGSSVFSPRAFLIWLVVTAGGAFLGGSLPLVGALGGLAGVLGGGFLLGLLAGDRRYVEAALAGAVAAGVGTVLDFLVLSVVGVGLPLVALGSGSGAIAAVLGQYFGRDLRAGLLCDL